MSEAILIRDSHEQDTQAIYEFVPNLPPLTPHTRYTYWNLFKNFGNACFIAFDEEKPVGFITSHPTTTPRNEWFIWQVGVLPEQRGTGLVDSLQDCVVRVAQESGAVALTTTIEADNPRSYGAFKRLARRLDSSLEEVKRLELTPSSPDEPPEVLYRIALPASLYPSDTTD